MNNSKKVLIFSHAYFPNWVGGAEIALKEITDQIPSGEIEFHLVTLGAGESDEKIGNINIHRVRPFGFLTYNKFLHKIAKYLFIFQAYLKAKKLHKKHGFNTIWSLMASYGGFSALFFKRKYKDTKFVLTLQEGDPIEYILKRLGIFKSFYRSIFKNADVVSVISTYLGKFAKDMGFKGEPIVVPNGVDVKHFSKEISQIERENIRQNFGFKNEDTVLVTASRLVRKNGVEDIISALKYLPESCKLLVVGVGELEGKLKDQSKNLGLEDRVKFAGFVAHTDLPKYLKSSDVFVRPSLSEGLGNSFLEAMAAGLPTVATPVGGIPDFLTHEETGLFCQVQNPESIATQVKRLKDENLKSLLIANAFKMVEQKYTWEKIAEEMKGIL